MYAHAVTGIVADEDFSTPHRVSKEITCSAMNHYFSRIHGVAASVLHVAMYQQVQAGARFFLTYEPTSQ